MDTIGRRCLGLIIAYDTIFYFIYPNSLANLCDQQNANCYLLDFIIIGACQNIKTY